MIRVEIILKQEAMDSSACPDMSQMTITHYLQWCKINQHFYWLKSVKVQQAVFHFIGSSKKHHFLDIIFDAENSSFDNTTHFDTPAFRKDPLHDYPFIDTSVKEGSLQGVNSWIKVKPIIYIVR